METISTQYNSKVHSLLVNIHQRLNQKFSFIQQSRELSNEQNILLNQLNKDSPSYKILVAVMAIDTYTQHIVQIYNEADSILQSLSITLSCVLKMKNEIQKGSNRTDLKFVFNNLYSSLINVTQFASILNPLSPYLQIYRKIIANQDPTMVESLFSNLKQQNLQLKQRLRINDEKIIDLQIKLTKILQQQQDCENQNELQGTLKSYELKEQLQKKENEIQKMNEEFSYQIEKYNMVYGTLKKQLEQYRSYQNVDTVELIEKLQTQIVLLREQREREQMINQELRHRLQILSEKDSFVDRNPFISNTKNFPKKRYNFYGNQFNIPYENGDLYEGMNDEYNYETNEKQYLDTQNDSSEQVNERMGNSGAYDPGSRQYKAWNYQNSFKGVYRY